MVIKSSTATEVRTLVAALVSSDDVRREAAIARLAVIGSRATDRLLAAYAAAADSGARVALLRAMEGIGDSRFLPLAAEALRQGGDAGVAAAALLEVFLDAADPSIAAAALDALVEAALNPSADRRVRLAAFEALQDIPAAMTNTIRAALHEQAGISSGEHAGHEALLADAVEGRVPDDPAPLRVAIVARGAALPLPSLLKLIEVAREREARAAGPPNGWLLVRGAAHQALATRDSRLAVYDLRESVAAADAALPPSFLAAMRMVGDASCVEALAAALSRAPADDLWWQHQLASALRGIAARERLTRRHPAIKRAVARWPQVAEVLGSR